MRVGTSIAILSVLTLAGFADSAYAGRIFGRVWERRRAELYADLSSGLGREINTEVAAAEKRLQDVLAVNVQTESKKLDEHVAREIAKLQDQARQQIAAEAHKLQEQVNVEVGKLRSAAQSAVADESKKLQDLVAQHIKTLQAEADKQLKDAIAKVDETMTSNMKKLQDMAVAEARTSSQDMQDSVKQQIERLRSEVKEYVKDELASLQPKSNVPSPASPRNERPKETAAPTSPPALQEEKQTPGGE